MLVGKTADAAASPAIVAEPAKKFRRE